MSYIHKVLTLVVVPSMCYYRVWSRVWSHFKWHHFNISESFILAYVCRWWKDLVWCLCLHKIESITLCHWRLPNKSFVNWNRWIACSSQCMLKTISKWLGDPWSCINEVRAPRDYAFSFQTAIQCATFHSNSLNKEPMVNFSKIA